MRRICWLSAMRDDTVVPSLVWVDSEAPGGDIVVITAVVTLISKVTKIVFLWTLTVPSLTQISITRHTLCP
jgi:hypothetical protein